MRPVFDTRYGGMECFEGDTVVCEALRRYGEWAQLELDMLARFVPVGGTVLDIGAFVGSHTLALAQMVGTGGEVHSFEARDAIRQVLRANVMRNGFSQVHVHGCALGRSDATLNILSVAADLSAERAVNFGGLALRKAEDGAPVESVSIRPLDAFGFERLDLMKIDVEGMEPEVIAGASATLDRLRPVIFAECNDLENGSEVLRICQALGYAVFGCVAPAYNPANFRGNPENIFGDAGEAALVAVAKERVASFEVQGALAGQARIDSVDALALLLLHKAQYPFEVLASSSAEAALGVRYASPLSRMLELENARLRAELMEALAERDSLRERLLPRP